MTDRRQDAIARRSRRSLWQRIVDLSLTDVGVLVRGTDANAIDELERLLLEADFGIDAAGEVVGALERAARRGEVRTSDELRAKLGAIVGDILRSAGPAVAGAVGAGGPPGVERSTRPLVTLLVGVNGTGKTTTAAKLASRYAAHGESVLLAATDTFRSGAQEQLAAWAGRLELPFVGGQAGADPAAVAYDAASAAVARGMDRLVVDTAGRLHTSGDLMDELAKIDRVLGRIVEGAPHERLLIVDATSGRNVSSQAREFGRRLPLAGLVLAKFDGTGKGGAAVAVARELGLGVRWLGTGEEPGDLEPFDADRYVRRLIEGA
ncbi:MAG: signal recognition particle-docking protein FtsY [Gemmatimonadota bacterium]